MTCWAGFSVFRIAALTRSQTYCPMVSVKTDLMPWFYHADEKNHLLSIRLIPLSLFRYSILIGRSKLASRAAL